MPAPERDALTGSEFTLRAGNAEQLLQVLLDKNEDGFALIELRFDADGRAVDARNLVANPALERHTGLRAAEIRNRWASEYLPHLEQSWLDAMAKALREGGTQRMEAFQQDTGRWYEAVYFPFSETIVGYFGRDVTDRHQAEERLAESQSRFRLLAENSSDLVFSITPPPSAAFTWTSPSFERILGWSQQDLLDRTLSDLVHHEDRATLLDGLRRSIDAGSTAIDVRLATTEGSYHWFSLGLHPVVDFADGAAVVVAGARIIDAERRAQERLRNSEGRLKATLDSLLDPHVVLQALRNRDGSINDFVVVEANEAACRYSSLSYDQIVGGRLMDLAPNVGERLLPALSDVVESGEPLVLDDFAEIMPPEAVARSGRRLDLRAVKVDDGLSYTWRDVTERYEGRQQVFASEERFRLAVGNVPTGIAVLDLGGRFDFVNPAFCNILQRDGEWLLRRNMQQVMYPGEYAKLRHMIGLLTSGAGMVQQAQQRFVTSDGTPVEARHTVALLHRADGEPVGLLSHVQPINLDSYGQFGQAASRAAAARASVLTTADERGTFPAICTTALLAQRPDLIVLPWATTTDLRVRLAKDTPEVLVLLTAPGIAGPAQLARVLTDVAAVAPQTALVVVSSNNRPQMEAMLRQRSAPSAFLPVNSVRSSDVLAQVIGTVSQGMGAFDPAAIEEIIGGTDQSGDTRLRKLSDREQEVLALLAEGLDNQAIANRLFVSVKACENYIGSIFRKLGLNTEEGTNRRVRATLMYLGER